MAFARQIAGSGAATWQNVQGVQEAPDYSGIFESAGAIAGEVFSGMAVDDLLGSDEVPTTSVSNPLDPAQPGMIDHTKGIPDIESISGLKGIRAAREQGILSGSRAQTMATRRLNESINQYPQYRDQLLAAYDNLVDPTGGRASRNIFEATPAEEFNAKQAEQRAKNEQKAMEAGYSTYEDYIFAQQKMRIQAEETARQDIKLQSQENILKARGMELEANIFRNSALVEAELGAFILQQVNQEGNLSPQTIGQLEQQITNAELQAKAKLATFRANPQFDYDTNLKQLEGMYSGLKSMVSDNSVQAKTTALLEQLKVASDADQWSRAPAVATLLSMGSSSGLDMIQALQRITGDQVGQATVREQLEAVVSDPKRALEFKTLIEDGLQTADFNDEDMDFFTTTLNSVKDVITDRADRNVVIQRMAEIGNMQTEQVANGTKEAPPIDEVVNGSIFSLADPKNRQHYESAEGRDVAVSYIANTLNSLEKQVARDAKGSRWELDERGNVVGYMPTFRPQQRLGAAFSPERGETGREMLSTQNTLINRGLLDAFRIHPSFLEGTTADKWKEQLVQELNRISSEEPNTAEAPLSDMLQQFESRAEERVANVPDERGLGVRTRIVREDTAAAEEEQRAIQGARNEDRNQRTREALDGVTQRIENFVRDTLPRRNQGEATTIPLEEAPQAEELPTLGAVEEMNNVNWDFIRQEEGFETRAYVPDAANSNSGVTVGSGVDLGQWNADSLSEMGVSADVIEKVRPYLGKKKASAERALRSSQLNLSQEEAMELTDKVKAFVARDVEDKYNESSRGWKFSELPEGIATAILSVGYQYGNMKARTPKFWNAITSNDWLAAYRELRNFGDRYSSRRNREADLMYASILRELGTQVATGGQ